MGILIARRTGMVVVEGRRRTVKRGVTTAETGAWIVARYPHLWEPIRVDYPAPDDPTCSDPTHDHSTSASLGPVPPADPAADVDEPKLAAKPPRKTARSKAKDDDQPAA